MRGIETPERTEDFTADPVELFFDLGFVFAFSQIVGHLVHHPDWNGVGEAALLFVLMWMPWSQFTWSANAVSGNGRVVRVFFLVATVASVPMAAAVSTAFGAGGPVFAISLGVIYVIALATMGLGLDRTSTVRRSLVRLAAPSLAAVVILVVGSFLDDGARVTVWIVALGVIGIGVAQAGGSEWIVRSGHIAERHGLIVIIALGEVIVAIGAPVVAGLEEGSGLPGPTVVALVGAGVFAALVWWSYFDRPGPALEHRGESVVGDRERGRYARDVYTMSHAPLVAGIILAAAAIEEMALHPDQSVPLSFRMMLAGGIALTVLGVVLGVWRAFGVPARERLVAAVALCILILPAAEMDGAVLLVAVDLVIVITLVAEHLRIER